MIDPTTLLQTVIPFRYLSPTERSAIEPDLVERRFAPGEIIISAGDGEDTDVYLLAEGTVEVFTEEALGERRITTIEASHYFGEWEPLFGVPRVYSIRATRACFCFALTGERFLSIVSSSPRFALALGAILRDRQGIFASFERFKVELIRGAGRGHLTITDLLPLYEKLEPAIHSGLASTEIDTAALAYAVRRLPANVSATFAYLLTDSVPPAYDSPNTLFTPIASDARRRDAWQMLPGKTLVQLRYGASDLLDFVTCLCVYAVEARKIRTRLEDAHALPQDDDCTEEEKLASLPFSPEETRGLQSIWPGNTIARLAEISRHRESFSVSVQRHSAKYNSQRSERWSTQLASACRELLGSDPVDLGDDVGVHIISSNTHSMTNCLNGWYLEHADRIIDWAREAQHPHAALEWANSMDAVYSLARDFFRAHPESAEQSAREEREIGILRMRETASTGIQAQLIDTARICAHQLDPGVHIASSQKGLIVNIDYAFGEQAEDILRNLLLLFGSRVRSVSLLGKAGALTGRRGDTLRPTAFIEQSSEQLFSLPPEREDVSLPGIRGEQVHSGPMLTVDGTLLQNETMLRFYKQIRKCIGIEMEGAYYFRQLREAQDTGLAPPQVKTHFYYYVSDLPLQPAERLSARLEPRDGVPPLYAITRHILNQILSE